MNTALLWDYITPGPHILQKCFPCTLTIPLYCISPPLLSSSFSSSHHVKIVAGACSQCEAWCLMMS